ncbi:MAG: YceI family protein [Candidatus Binatia bacterium]
MKAPDHPLLAPGGVGAMVAVALAATVVDARADARTMMVEFDPAATQVRFQVDSTLHTVRGTARLSGGHITFDLSGGEVSGRFVVDARSTDTGNGLRDRRMHNEILESERYPNIVFTPISVQVSRLHGKSGTVQLAGQVGIHGTDWPLTIPAHVHVAGERIHVEAAFSIPYVAWGMPDMSNFLLKVAPSVDVFLDAVGTIRTPPAPPHGGTASKGGMGQRRASARRE